MRKTMLLSMALLPLLFVACPNPPADPPRDSRIYLEITDTWTTSITLNISVADTTLPWDFALSRNGSVVHEGRVEKADTILVDENLIPNTSYNYMTYFVEDGNVKDSSLVVNTTTMDTTSHDFTWTIDTLGEYGSYLNDVHIVNENDIWVVGEIQTDSCSYNAAHWDGNEWEYMRIINSAPLYSIFYFNENDIWVSSMGVPKHWDGSDWTMYHLQDMGLDVLVGNAMWGTSSSNMYFVGRKGSIVHYDGSEFVKMESGTDVDLKDIWGIEENALGQGRIWVAGYTNLLGSVLLQYENDMWETSFKLEPPPPSATTPNQISWVFTSVYTDNPDTVYLASAGRIYYTPWNTNGYARENFWYDYNVGEEINAPPCSCKLRGNSKRDMFVVGQDLDVRHYNGVHWHQYEQLVGTGRYYSISINGDAVVVAGSYWKNLLQHQAIVARGKR